jgi:16S rRNA (guanine527-N7)-methyltransferase
MRSKSKNSQPENVEREIDELRSGLVELGVDFDADVIARFEDYMRILYSYHGKLHLLSHRDYERISRRHFLPSLVALQYVRDHRRVCDVGAGAGFPSIPLKVILPALDLVIFESVGKKADFLRFLVDGLRLEGIEIRNERAEDYSGKGFDLMLFRAVGRVAKLLRVVDKLLVPGGKAIFFKSQHVDSELRQAEAVMKKKGYTAGVITLSTPVEGLPLALVILNKLC